uniref:Uncharacterized protein n=1 Tax=Tanacetum cinerariifolium TaxID=118510 RepID=A0A6L2NFM2_TANCI|nr:hypothetical protein [Tanacetum cinerariifolium]
MSGPDETSPPMQLSKPPPLHKHKSLSTDLYREEVWLRRKSNHNRHNYHGLHRRSKSLITTEDIDEFKGCLDLGFHFASEGAILSKMLPALDLYYATSSQPASSSNSSTTTSPHQPCSPHTTTTPTTLFNSGEDPKMIKRRLKQWAQVVACAARQPACYQTEPKD